MSLRRADLCAALGTAAVALCAIVSTARSTTLPAELRGHPAAPAAELAARPVRRPAARPARRHGDPPAAPTRATYAPYLAAYAPPAPAPEPADNASTPARQALGKRLFFDPQLSGPGKVSCATCHDPAAAWADRRPRAVGVTGVALGRRTPTILNTAWAAALMWDGRFETLEQQALGPIQAPGEMGMSALATLERRLNADATYRAAFLRAYGTDTVTTAHVTKAIAAFERGVVSAPAPFDRWAAGDDRAISAQAKRGFLLFNTKAGCATCHSGWRFTDDSFHDIGVAADRAAPDSGRAHVVPGVEALAFAFKTPTLRNVADRAPYLHDGSERTLAAVVDLYNRGGRARRASVASEVKPLGLTPDDQRALVAFLRTLSSRDTVAVPAAPVPVSARPLRAAGVGH